MLFRSLWKDSSRSGEAGELMKLTAQDLYRDGIVEELSLIHIFSFARTILHKPSVMILDEATANIDTETERIFSSES